MAWNVGVRTAIGICQSIGTAAWAFAWLQFRPEGCPGPASQRNRERRPSRRQGGARRLVPERKAEPKLVPSDF